MPDYKKIITIISNNSSFDEGYTFENVIKFENIHMCDVLYPGILINKMYIVEQNINENADYVFYFDADTIFINNKNYDWDKLISDCDSGRILLEKTPVYNVLDDFIFHIGNEPVTKEYYIHVICGGRNDVASYIEELNHDYICAAFFGGARISVENFCNKICDMIKFDYNFQKGYFVPHYYDEAYVNKIVNEIPDEFIVKGYSKLYVFPSYDNEDIFMFQKQIHDENKSEKR